MTNEFKIISEDGLKTLCKAIKKTSTVGEIIDDVNSVTDKTYSSFEIDRRLNTKVDKTDIVDNLTSTDTDKPLSANQGKILNDTKLNKTDANKLNCVTIDNVSLKEYILTNFTETGKTYYLIAKTTCTDLPKVSNFYITVETPGLYTYKVTAKELNDSNGIYACSYRTISSSWTAWQKVCTTTVADVPVTPINIINGIVNPNCNYQVKNGICYIQFNSGTYNLGENVNGLQLATNMPIPASGTVTHTYVPWAAGDASKQVILFVDGNGSLLLHAPVGANRYYIYTSFSYPVAE